MTKFTENFFNPDEDLKLVVKKHWLVLLKPLAIAFLLICLPFLFIVPLWRLGNYGIAFFLVVILSGIFVFFKYFFKWYFSSYVITDQRAIDIERSNFFKEEISSVYFEQVDDIIFRKKGFKQIFWRLGSIEIEVEDGQTVFVWPDLRNPKKIYQVLEQQRQQRLKEVRQPSAIDSLRREFGQLTDEEIVDLLFELKKSIGERRFKKLINRFG